MLRLALALGKTVGEIERLPASEYDDWIAFDKVEPIGSPHMDFLIGSLRHTVAMFSGRMRKGTSPKAFFFEWGDKQELTSEQRERIKSIQSEVPGVDVVRQLNALFGGSEVVN